MSNLHNALSFLEEVPKILDFPAHSVDDFGVLH